jgi:hypothetical protein
MWHPAHPAIQSDEILGFAIPAPSLVKQTDEMIQPVT